MEEKFKQLSSVSFRKPCHLPQFKLIDVLHKNLTKELDEDDHSFLYDNTVQDFKIDDDKVEKKIKKGISG